MHAKLNKGGDFIMKLRKSILKIAFCAMALAGMTGCDVTTSKALTFNIKNGDKIKVQLDTTDGYALTNEEGIFKVEKDDETIMHGIFLTEEMYENYLTNVQAASTVTVIEDRLEDQGYLFYKVEEGSTEYDYLFMVKDSNTGILTGSIKSKEVASEVFQRLEVTKAE